MSAPAATTTTSAPVHVILPHFNALFEGAVNWSACGPVANEVAVAALEGRLPDPNNAKAVVARDTSAGRFGRGGQTLSDIAWDLAEQRGYTALTTVGYSSAPNLDALHALLKLGGLSGWPVILQVARAYNLPDNEAGVNYHFVVSGGIDSALGYLIANGDTRTGIRLAPQWPASTHIPLNWASWATLVNAGVCGAILVRPKGYQPPATPADPAPSVTLTAAQLATLQQQVAQALSEAAQVVNGAQGVSSAIAALQSALTAI